MGCAKTTYSLMLISALGNFIAGDRWQNRLLHLQGKISKGNVTNSEKTLFNSTMSYYDSNNSNSHKPYIQLILSTHNNKRELCNTIQWIILNFSVRACLIVVLQRSRSRSRVNEWNHDVSSAASHSESFMIVGQSSRVHERPTETGLCHTAVVADKTTSSSLQSVCVCVCVVGGGTVSAHITHTFLLTIITYHVYANRTQAKKYLQF